MFVITNLKFIKGQYDLRILDGCWRLNPVGNCDIVWIGLWVVGTHYCAIKPTEGLDQASICNVAYESFPGTNHNLFNTKLACWIDSLKSFSGVATVT